MPKLMPVLIADRGVTDETTELLAEMELSTARFTATKSITSESRDDVDPTTANYRPHSFGAYDLIKLISRGGMGTVWLAHQRALDRNVAIKLFPLNRLACEQPQGRFIKKLAAHGRLKHDNLVCAYDAGEVDGVPFLAMELLDGKDASVFCLEDRLLPVIYPYPNDSPRADFQGGFRISKPSMQISSRGQINWYRLRRKSLVLFGRKLILDLRALRGQSTAFIRTAI